MEYSVKGTAGLRRSGRSALSALRPTCAPGRLATAGVIAVSFAVSQGCYTYTPIAGRVDPGSTVSLNLNDRGRAELGDQIGAAAVQVEGALRSETDSIYVLNVTSVRYQNGQSNAWSGEQLAIAKAQVSTVREREFSRGRTAIAAGGGVGAVLLFALTRSLVGNAPAPVDPGPGDPPVDN